MATNNTNSGSNGGAKYFKSEAEIEAFYKDNLRLVHSIANTFRGSADYDDLFQEASVGFILGARSYSPDRGTRPSTFAAECARRSILMMLRKGRAASRTAVTVSLDLSVEKTGSERDSALNKKPMDVDDLHQHKESMEELVARHDIFERALTVVKDMNPVQQTVLYGYMNGVPQAETAVKLNVSQGQVSKILRQSICELVSIMKQRNLL